MTYLDDLRAANPAPGESPYGEHRAADLIADITSGRVTAPPPPPAPSRRPWLVGGIAVAAAATLAGVLIIPPMLRHDAAVSPGLPVPTSSVTVPRQPTPTSATQYWKTVTTGTATSGALGSNGLSAMFAVSFTSTSYDPVDHSGSSYQVYDGLAGTLLAGSPRLPAPQAAHQVVARPAGKRAAGSAGGWQTPGPTWAQALPRDVAALRAKLYADAAARSPYPDWSAFDAAVKALMSEELPQDLRAVLVQVVGTIPGAKVVEGASGPGGELADTVTFEGIGYAASWPDVIHRRLLVLDRQTGVAYRDTTTVTSPSGGMAAGTVISDTRVTVRQLVDAVPADLLAATNRPCTTANWTNGRPSGCDIGATSASTTQPTPAPASR